MPKKSYPGVISSSILSVFVLILFLLPFYTANHMEKVRNGEDEYEFKEVMCWDISKKSEFQPDDFDDLIVTPRVYGGGAFIYRYYSGAYLIYSHQPVVMLSTPIDGVIDGYAGSIVEHISGEPYTSGGDIYFCFTLTKNDILKFDITRIDVYLYVEGISNIPVRIGFFAQPPSIGLFGYDIYVSGLSEIPIGVDELLKINAMGDEQQLYCMYVSIGSISDNTNVYFDMQFYCIEEIKIITIDWMGIVMAGGGIFMGFCSILMLPHVTFSGVIGRIVGKGS